MVDAMLQREELDRLSEDRTDAPRGDVGGEGPSPCACARIRGAQVGLDGIAERIPGCIIEVLADPVVMQEDRPGMDVDIASRRS